MLPRIFFCRIAICVLALCFHVVAHAGFDEGRRAFDSGDLRGAYHEWRLLAEKGDAKAQGQLGRLYFLGLGTEKDEAQAVYWFRKSAEQGDSTGQWGLGNMYRSGKGGLAKDQDQALFWLTKAAKQDDPRAQMTLGTIFLSETAQLGSTAVADTYFKEGLANYIRQAEQGYVDAQTAVFQIYLQYPSLFRVDDPKRVASWLRNAAERGFPGAQSMLGYAYRTDTLAPRDDQQAIFWYRKAADQGEPAAQTALGRLYDEGYVVPKDEAVALDYFRKAASQGWSEAQFFLGTYYEEGRGVPKDEEHALQWYRKSADQGYVSAVRRLKEIEAGKR